MSNLDLNDWEFADDEEANMTIRAAVHYRLKGVAGGDRGRYRDRDHRDRAPSRTRR
jgi:hypothetical protein